MCGEQRAQVCKVLRDEPTGAEDSLVDAKVRHRLLPLSPRLSSTTATVAADHRGHGRGGLIGAHRVSANEAHAKRDEALRDVWREPRVVEVVVRGRPRVMFRGGDGGSGGSGGGRVPVAVPTGVEENRGAGADAVGHGLDSVPGDALAGLLVRHVQDEDGEYERAQRELVDGGTVNEEV